MLARHFTITCILVALMGLGLSIMIDKGRERPLRPRCECSSLVCSCSTGR